MDWGERRIFPEHGDGALSSIQLRNERPIQEELVGCPVDDGALLLKDPLASDERHLGLCGRPIAVRAGRRGRLKLGLPGRLELVMLELDCETSPPRPLGDLLSLASTKRDGTDLLDSPDDPRLPRP